jgi:hypothetical protein
MPEEAKQPVSTKTEPKVKNKAGRPTKATDETLAAILDDMALGMTEDQACAGNGVRAETFSRWKNQPEYEWLRGKAAYYRIKTLLHKQETDPSDWKRFAWQLERIYRSQYGDPAKIGVQINQQFNNGNRSFNQAELEDVRQRLDRVDLLQQKWKAGVATNAELHEHLVEKRDQLQHLIDCLEAGETPDQETQQQLYRLHEEKSDRQSPIRAVEGHVTDSNAHALLAIEAPPEPERAVPPVSQAPPEPHVRQRDKKLPVGPPSLRQRLEQEKARRGGDGKMPF